MASKVDSESKKKVLEALGNPKFKWRTIKGIAKETNVGLAVARQVIEESPEIVIQSSIPGPRGEELFTTRNNYLKQASWLEKFQSAITNRLG